MSDKAQPPPEEGGENVPLWYVSFADMITLLLSFFVMLTTFSSYDDEHLKKFTGACQYIAANSVFPGRTPPRDSFVQTPDRPIDFTKRGSEKPDDMSDQDTQNPKTYDPPPDQDAYKQRKVLSIPVNTLWESGGSSDHLSPQGQALLGRIAEFIRTVPCQVLISQPPNAEAAARLIPSRVRLQRALEIVRYFTEDQKLSPERFGLAVGPASAARRASGQAVIEMTLISGGVYGE